MQTDIAKLNSSGRTLHDMLLETHKLLHLTPIQIQRILSFQKRIISVDTNNGSSTDIYPKRFKIDKKGKHGGYLNTRKFWKSTSIDSVGLYSRGNTKGEQVIAQA